MKQIKGLDTLRAFAVIFVIIQHWGPVYDASTPVELFVKTILVPDGATGVYIFFTLSGFLITSILVNARFSTTTPDRPSILKNFIIRRTLRIFPIYYIFLFALYHLLSWPAMKSELPWCLTYTTNFMIMKTNSWAAMAGHLWTLAIEEQFYLLWPWIILFVNEKYLKYVFAAGILAGVVTTCITLQTKIEPFMVYNCMDSFAIGGFYAYARRDADFVKKFEKVVKWVGPFLLIPYFGWKLLAFKLSIYTLIILKKTADSFIAIWLIVLIVNNKSERNRKYFLENRSLNFIGRISYCVYLIHPFVPRLTGPLFERLKNTFQANHAVSALLDSYNFLYLLNLGILFTTCWLSYILIEKPILSLKRFFEYK